MKYISPGSWFSLEYPAGWHEFEDTEDSFLFYNPEKWNGNFRISAFKGQDKNYADECMDYELKNNRTSRLVKVGEWSCVYSTENFQENGNWYTSHGMKARPYLRPAFNTNKKYVAKLVRSRLLNVLRQKMSGG